MTARSHTRLRNMGRKRARIAGYRRWQKKARAARKKGRTIEEYIPRDRVWFW